jgi:hypothetical protein
MRQCGRGGSRRLEPGSAFIPVARGYNAAQSRMTFPDFPEFMISNPSR